MWRKTFCSILLGEREKFDHWKTGKSYTWGGWEFQAATCGGTSPGNRFHSGSRTDEPREELTHLPRCLLWWSRWWSDWRLLPWWLPLRFRQQPPRSPVETCERISQSISTVGLHECGQRFRKWRVQSAAIFFSSIFHSGRVDQDPYVMTRQHSPQNMFLQFVPTDKWCFFLRGQFAVVWIKVKAENGYS